MRMVGGTWVLVIWLASSVAAAQVPDAPPAQGVAPLDVVTLRGGGMLRGTIVESMPGQYVVIALATGETRRIEWAEVEYAGPAASAPNSIAPNSIAPSSVAPNSIAPERARVHLRLSSPQDNITFHRVTGTAHATAWGYGGAAAIQAFSFERMCTAPCEIDIEPGNYQLALSVGTGNAIPGQAFDLNRDGTLSGTYDDRTGMRVGGFILIGAGGAAGAGLLLVPLFTGDVGSSSFIDAWIPWLIAGTAVLLVSEIVGLILAMQGDSAVIRFD